MNLTPEQTKELAEFPPVLRALVEAELAAGNAIVEIAHGHPAPPVGAYLKFAHRITTRRRASGDGLSFYERQSSSHCGEFTDDRRFFYVLEAPPPPPEEPDMDAIRAALQPKPDAVSQPAQRQIADGEKKEKAVTPRRSAPKTPKTPKAPKRPRSQSQPAPEEVVFPADRALTVTETEVGIRQLLHFRDPRAPHLVQFALERELMRPFLATLEEGRLTLRAQAEVNGLRCDFELRFLAALPTGNRYSLLIEASWADQPASSHDYFRNSARSWLRMWTQSLAAANPPEPGEGVDSGYRSLGEATLLAQADLNSVEAVRKAILAGLARGGSYATTHHEGGTHIAWRGGRYVRTDFGEHPHFAEYSDEAEFLKMLRQFCQVELGRHTGKEPLSELDTWKLILRRMDPNPDLGQGGSSD